MRSITVISDVKEKTADMVKNSDAETAFFRSGKKIKYNGLCRGCPEKCKQSFRAAVIACPRRK